MVVCKFTNIGKYIIMKFEIKHDIIEIIKLE